MNLNQSKLEELKRKILATLFLVVVYRFGAQVPVPGVDASALKSFFDQAGVGLFDMLNTFSGGSLKRLSVLALGIMPYITTSIIFSLLGEVVPQLAELQDDSEGHRRIQKWTRYATVLLCMVQGYGLTAFFESQMSPGGQPVVPEPGISFRIVTMLTLTTGTMFLLFLGERITEYALENGVSLIIFAGIAAEVPSEFIQKIELYRNNELSGFHILLSLLIIFGGFYLVAFVEKSFRNVHVQYAKKIINNKVYSGQQTLPMKVDTGGVMPVILASSLLGAPATLSSMISRENPLHPYIDPIVHSLYPGRLLHNILLIVLIFYMTYFYAPIQFKTKKIAEMLKKNNAFIPGVRPGEKTQAFLDFILDRLSFFGALFLITICIVPTLFADGTRSRLGGTSLLILVSVCIRVMMNVQAFIFSEKYQDSYKNATKPGKFSGPRRRF